MARVRLLQVIESISRPNAMQADRKLNMKCASNVVIHAFMNMIIARVNLLRHVGHGYQKNFVKMVTSQNQ